MAPRTNTSEAGLESLIVAQMTAKALCIGCDQRELQLVNDPEL
jgi:hypothetical protein